MNKDQLQHADDSEARLQRLLALKRYEQPDAYFETRNLAALREQLAHTAPGSSWAVRAWEWLTGGPAPALGIAGAAVAIVAGVWFMGQPSTTTTSTAPVFVEIAPEPAPEEPALAAAPLDAETEVYRKPVFVFEYPSNREPRGPVQMGPGSVPVRYDF